MSSRDPIMVRRLYKAQRGYYNAPCEDYVQRRGIFLPEKLLELDHIDSKGSDDIENRQLLCSHCNRVKGDRPMEYLTDYHRVRSEKEQMRRSQLTLIPQERMAKKGQAVVTKRRPQPQYMHNAELAACVAMAGALPLLFAESSLGTILHNPPKKGVCYEIYDEIFRSPFRIAGNTHH